MSLVESLKGYAIEAPKQIAPPVFAFVAGMVVAPICGIPATAAVVGTMVVTAFVLDQISEKVLKEIPYSVTRLSKVQCASYISFFAQTKLLQTIICSAFPPIIPSYLNLILFQVLTGHVVGFTKSGLNIIIGSGYFTS